MHYRLCGTGHKSGQTGTSNKILRGDYEMNDKSILDILEEIVKNSTIDICADKFQELEFKIWELQEGCK